MIEKQKKFSLTGKKVMFEKAQITKTNNSNYLNFRIRKCYINVVSVHKKANSKMTLRVRLYIVRFSTFSHLHWCFLQEHFQAFRCCLYILTDSTWKKRHKGWESRRFWSRHQSRCENAEHLEMPRNSRIRTGINTENVTKTYEDVRVHIRVLAEYPCFIPVVRND